MIRQLRRIDLSVVPAPLWLALALILTPIAVAFASANGMILLLAGCAIALCSIVAAVARPLPFLLIYVALIPAEAIVVLGDAATLTRAIGAVLFGGYLLRRLGEIEVRSVPAVGWAFVAWAAASALWALDPTTTLTQIATLLQLVAITLVIVDLIGESPAAVDSILWTYSGSAVLVATLAIGEYLLVGSPGSDRAAAFAAQGPAHLAAVLLPAFFHLVFQVVARPRRPWVYLALLVVVGAIVLSGTRSAWVAIGLAMVVAVVPKLGARAFVPTALLGLTLVVVLQIPEIGSLYAERASSALETGGAGRVDIWSVGLTIVSRSPLVGVGYENFPIAFTPEVIRSAEVPGLNLGILIPGLAPHSIIIGTLAELGVIGLVLLGSFMLTTLLRPTTGPWGFPAKVMLLGLLFQALFLDLLARKQVWLMIALVLGLAAAEVRDRRRQRAEEETKHRQFADRVRGTWEMSP